ncbi:MAG: pilus assembly protein TadG-related protein, partial [Rhodospirillales bacterium]
MTESRNHAPATDGRTGPSGGGTPFKALARDRRGVIVVLFALLLPIMLGFIGIGVELGYWFMQHRDLQAAADAAAIAGSYELAEDRASSIGSIATQEAENNGWSATDGTITIRSQPFNSTFPASGAFTADNKAVEVLLTRTVGLLFSGYFLDNPVTINSRAVGLAVAGATTACVLALGNGLSSGASAITASGGASVSMSGCTLATNSTNSAAIKLSGGGSITADCVYSSGGVSGTPVTTQCSGAKENQPAVVDPYATIPQPTFSACSNPADKYSLTGSSSDTLDAGTKDVYCSISSSSSGTLELNAGTYFLDGGDFKISGSGNVESDGQVTIIL